MALTIATLLQKTTMIVGDTLLPETTHAALTIALECDDLLAFSKCQKTFVASAVGGVYAAIVVSQMENVMRIAALATNPELAGFEGFSDESAGETGAQGTWTQGHDTDKTIPMARATQMKVKQLSSIRAAGNAARNKRRWRRAACTGWARGCGGKLPECAPQLPWTA